MKKLTWILSVSVMLGVWFTTTSPMFNEARAEREAAATTPRRTTKATVVWPKTLPKPSQLVLRKQPPEKWRHPRASTDDVFEHYPCLFTADELEQPADLSFPSLLTHLQDVAPDYNLNPESVGPIYLVHSRDQKGKATLCAAYLTTSARQGDQMGKLSWELSVTDGRAKLSLLDFVIPIDRPLCPAERERLIQTTRTIHRWDTLKLSCEAAIIVRHSKEGAMLSGFATAVPDYEQARQVDGGMMIDSFWVTNLYVFDPKAFVYYSEEVPKYWQ